MSCRRILHIQVIPAFQPALKLCMSRFRLMYLQSSGLCISYIYNIHILSVRAVLILVEFDAFLLVQDSKYN